MVYHILSLMECLQMKGPSARRWSGTVSLMTW